MVRTSGLEGYSDEHYTEPHVARAVVDHFRPQGRILEPFAGDGVFLDALPYGTHYCDLEADLDFFEWERTVDWIVTNPPWSNLTEVMAHAFEIARYTVLLVPLSKIYSSEPRLELVRTKAGIREQLMFGSGRNIGFDIGFPCAAIQFERGYHGPTKTVWWRRDEEGNFRIGGGRRLDRDVRRREAGAGGALPRRGTGRRGARR